MPGVTIPSGARDHFFFLFIARMRRWACVYRGLLTLYVQLDLNVPMITRGLRPACRQPRNIKTSALGIGVKWLTSEPSPPYPHELVLRKTPPRTDLAGLWFRAETGPFICWQFFLGLYRI